MEEVPGWNLKKAGCHVGQRQCETMWDLVGQDRKKRVKGLLLVGHEEVPRGFGNWGWVNTLGGESY